MTNKEIFNAIEKVVEEIDVLNNAIYDNDDMMLMYIENGVWNIDDYSYTNILNVLKDNLKDRYCS